MLCGGISPTDLLVDDAKKAPAIPATDTTLLGRFTFKLRFACGIAEFLLANCSSNKGGGLSLCIRRFNYL
jgi:hypothetical protein